MKNKVLLSVVVMFFTSLFVQAQSFEIRAMNKGAGTIGVEMRIISGAPPDVTKYVTDMVFGLKWLSSYKVDLLSTITTNFRIVKSDSRKTKGLYDFQAFSANNTPFLFPTSWAPNEWVEIMTVRNTLSGTGMGTFEVTERGFNNSTDPNFGINLVDFEPAVVASAINVPLPVKLTSFEAIPKKTHIVLQWKTEYEQNSKSFDVQRADKENMNYQTIGTLKSKGGNGSKYEFADKNVTVGVKYLYRLKQIDNDDRFLYSEIRTAQLEELDNLAIHIMPNPTDKTLQVVFGSGLETGIVNIKITDVMGTLLFKKSHDLNLGNKAIFNVYSLASGQYFLSVENNKGLLYSKVFLKK